MVTILTGDCREILKTMPDASVHCCVTSPPYWGLRDYGHDGQIGLERTPEEYVANLVAVFREVRRVLRDDGTLWLVIGDSYNAYNGNRGDSRGVQKNAHEIMPDLPKGYGLTCKTLKPKDLVGIPWRVAFALQADGWYLRQDIIWAKGCSGNIRSGSAMPESVRDRFQKSHEYLFLFSKSARYFFDDYAVKDSVDTEAVKGYILHHEDQRGIHERMEAEARQHGKSTRNEQEVSGKRAREKETPSLFEIGEDGGGAEEVGGVGSRKVVAGAVSASLQEIRTTQSGTAALLRERQRQGHDQAVPGNSQRQRVFAAGSTQAAGENEADGMRPNSRAMGRHQGPTGPCVRGLRRDEAFDEGPHSAAQQRRPAHGVQHSGAMPKLQQPQERQVTRRSVWTVPTQPYSGAHFATFPPKLIEPCILAGTSERGCCPKCGKPWVRVVARGALISTDGTKDTYRPTKATDDPKIKGRSEGWTPNHCRESRTTGWRPGCECGGDPVPCTVLDPFFGSGTTGEVAAGLGRDCIGMELSGEYAKLARERCGLFCNNTEEPQ